MDLSIYTEHPVKDWKSVFCMEHQEALKQEILKILHQYDSFHGRMTIDILFIAKNKLVLRVNLCFSNFGRKILDEIPIEVKRNGFSNTMITILKKTFTNQKFIEKVWYACVRHGYISEDYDVMGKLLDTMRILL